MGRATIEDADEDAWGPAKKDLIDAKSIKINLDQLETGKNYYFRICTVNKAGQSRWVYVGPVCCAEAIEDPKICLPRALNKLVKPGLTEYLQIYYVDSSILMIQNIPENIF